MDQDQTQRAQDLRKEINALEGRDLQLWSIGILIILVVAAGFVALVLPNLTWELAFARQQGRYLPQLFFGFIALIILFNIYVLQQRRQLGHTREELIRQLIRSEAAEKLSLVDPLTEIFNRRYLEKIVTKETTRAERLGTGLTFLMIDVDNFKSANTRFGHLAGDRILTEVALLMKRTFRTSDTVIRYGGDEFLILLPETNEQQAQRAVERLLQSVENWNRSNTIVGYKMSLSCGLAAYSKGANVTEVLEAADQRMYQHKARSETVGQS